MKVLNKLKISDYPVKIEKVHFEDLLIKHQIPDTKKSNFISYLKYVWRDMLELSEDKFKGVSKLSFSKIFLINGIINERLFKVISKCEFITRNEFVNGMLIIFNGTFKQKIKLCFKIFDFDSDGFITKLDIRMILSFIPTSCNKTLNYSNFPYETHDLNDLNKTQQELIVLLNCYEEDKKYNLKEYFEIISSKKSESFYYLIFYLLENKPFTYHSVFIFDPCCTNTKPNKGHYLNTKSSTHSFDYLKHIKPDYINQIDFIKKISREQSINSDVSLDSDINNSNEKNGSQDISKNESKNILKKESINSKFTKNSNSKKISAELFDLSFKEKNNEKIESLTSKNEVLSYNKISSNTKTKSLINSLVSESFKSKDLSIKNIEKYDTLKQDLKSLHKLCDLKENNTLQKNEVNFNKIKSLSVQKNSQILELSRKSVNNFSKKNSNFFEKITAKKSNQTIYFEKSFNENPIQTPSFITGSNKTVYNKNYKKESVKVDKISFNNKIIEHKFTKKTLNLLQKSSKEKIIDSKDQKNQIFTPLAEPCIESKFISVNAFTKFPEVREKFKVQQTLMKKFEVEDNINSIAKLENLVLEANVLVEKVKERNRNINLMSKYILKGDFWMNKNYVFLDNFPEDSNLIDMKGNIKNVLHDDKPKKYLKFIEGLKAKLRNKLLATKATPLRRENIAKIKLKVSNEKTPFFLDNIINSKNNNFSYSDYSLNEISLLKIEIELIKIIGGYLIRKIPFKGTFIKLYYLLIHYDFYFFTESDETKKQKGFINIKHYFLEYNKNDEELKFTLRNRSKIKTYYCCNKEDFESWTSILKNLLEYRNVFDDYECKEKIGTGCFGEIKLGINKINKRRVAIKEFIKKKMTSLNLMMLKNEIDLHKISFHTNLIKFYDYYETYSEVYIVMEYCEGGDLFSYLVNRSYKLKEQHAASIIFKISCAVKFLHYFGFIHRDIKPENILMTDNGDSSDIRLIDFGFSKFLGPDYVKTNDEIGTYNYIAPEIFSNNFYNKKIDTYSIGVVAYLCLTGTLPFDDELNNSEIKRQIIEERAVFPKSVWKSLSESAKDCVYNLIIKNVDLRLDIDGLINHPWLNNYK